jgi:hypothetical protein
MSNSVFGISLTRGQYTGFFIFYDFLVFILPSTLLLNFYPIESFWVAFKVKQSVVFYVSVIILSSYSLLILLLFFFYKLKPSFFIYEEVYLVPNDVKVYRRFVFYNLLMSLLLIFFVWLFYGVGHSFSLSIFSNENIGIARMALNDNIITKFSKHFFTILSPILIIIVASPVFKEIKLLRVLSLLSILFLATWGGSKAPVLLLFLIYFATWATFSKFKISFISFIKVLFFTVILLFIVYHVVLLQYPHMTDLSVFFDYFFQRVFVAQMIGIYEQFSLNIHDTLYFLHGIPFSSFFIDYPVFHKDLMMISEDRSDPSSIGIKNTYFVAEAYAMGGWYFIIQAVIIFTLNLALSYVLLFKTLNILIANNKAFNKLISSIFLFSYISVTGGFSELMLFKVMFMMYILMFPVFVLAYLSRFKLICD